MISRFLWTRVRNCSRVWPAVWSKGSARLLWDQLQVWYLYISHLKTPSTYYSLRNNLKNIRNNTLKWEMYSRSVCLFWSAPNINSVCSGWRHFVCVSFMKICSVVFIQSCRQTNKQTGVQKRRTCAPCGGNNHVAASSCSVTRALVLLSSRAGLNCFLCFHYTNTRLLHRQSESEWVSSLLSSAPEDLLSAARSPPAAGSLWGLGGGQFVLTDPADPDLCPERLINPACLRRALCLWTITDPSAPANALFANIQV